MNPFAEKKNKKRKGGGGETIQKSDPSGNPRQKKPRTAPKKGVCVQRRGKNCRHFIVQRKLKRKECLGEDESKHVLAEAHKRVPEKN